MLLAGDEIGRTQHGNNNAYCQDNETVLARLDARRRASASCSTSSRRMIALRRAHPVFRRRDFFQGRPLHGSDVKDIAWLQPDGTEMTRAGMGAATSRAASACISAATRSTRPTRAAGRCVDDELPAAVQRAPRRDAVHAAGDCGDGALAACCSTPRATTGWPRDGICRAGDAYALAGPLARAVAQSAKPRDEARARACRSARELRRRRRRASASGRRRASASSSCSTRRRSATLADAARTATAGSRLTLPGAAPARAIAYRIDGGLDVPDPASRFNPDDVHGAERGRRSAAPTTGATATGAAGRGTRR